MKKLNTLTSSPSKTEIPLEIPPEESEKIQKPLAKLESLRYRSMNACLKARPGMVKYFLISLLALCLLKQLSFFIHSVNFGEVQLQARNR